MKTARIQGVPLMLVCFFFLFFSSCAHLVHLDRAQNAFNRGAEMENRIRFFSESGAPFSPTLLYNQAYAEVQKSLKQEDKLKSEHVLGNAYCIQALCEWKLKRYDEAEKSAEKALNAFLDLEEQHHIQMPRDKVIMETLPLIIQLEKIWAAAQLFHQPDNNTFESGKTHYLTYIHDSDANKEASLEQLLAQLEKHKQAQQYNEELFNYLLLVQLTALKNWSNTLDMIRAAITEDASLRDRAREDAVQFLFKQKEEDFKKEKNRLLEELAKTIPTGKEHPIYQFWNKVM